MLDAHECLQDVNRTNPAGNFLQFIIGGCLFGSGGFLLSNQVMVSSGIGLHHRGGFSGGFQAFNLMTPGMGLLMIPLGIGVCLLFAETWKRTANLLIWASLAALLVGILNSIHISFRPTTLWQLGTYIVMIAAGGGLMFRGLQEPRSDRDASHSEPASRQELQVAPSHTGRGIYQALRREMERQSGSRDS